jgi:hypothetical protein
MLTRIRTNSVGRLPRSSSHHQSNPHCLTHDTYNAPNNRPSSFGWRGVSCAYDAKKPGGGLLAGGGSKMGKKATSADGQRVQVLHEIDGYVERGEMLAIIGACVCLSGGGGGGGGGGGSGGGGSWLGGFGRRAAVAVYVVM